jgi:hypothetical protein
MTDKEAMAMALEALENVIDAVYVNSELEAIAVKHANIVITALKARLAQDKALQALHNENERLGLYQDAYAEQESVCDKDPQGCWNVRCQLGKKCKNTPPQRKPLTEQEMFEAIRPLYSSEKDARLTVAHSEDEYRAIEAAHGIKENT